MGESSGISLSDCVLYAMKMISVYRSARHRDPIEKSTGDRSETATQIKAATASPAAPSLPACIEPESWFRTDKATMRP
jgi:hypothetical protein